MLEFEFIEHGLLSQWCDLKEFGNIYSQNKFKPRVVYAIQACTSDLDTSICVLIPPFKVTRKLEGIIFMYQCQRHEGRREESADQILIGLTLLYYTFYISAGLFKKY